MYERMPNTIHSIIPAKLRNFVELQEIASSKKVFKHGSIELNGSRIQVSSGDTLESFAVKINSKKHRTKVEAAVISNETHTKLLLKSKGKELNFNDSNGIFTNHFTSRKLGITSKALIQVVRDSSYIKPSDVLLSYSVATKRQPVISVSTLNEFNKFELSRFDTNNSANAAPRLEAAPKVPMIQAVPLVFNAAGVAAMVPYPVVPGLATAPEVTVTSTTPHGEPAATHADMAYRSSARMLDAVDDHPLNPSLTPISRVPHVEPLEVSAEERAAIAQHNERVRLKKIQHISELIIINAIALAMSNQGLTRETLGLKEELIDRLSNALFRVKRDSNPEDLMNSSFNLTQRIADRIVYSHRHLWAFLSLSSYQLQISEQSIFDMRTWIFRNA